MEASVTFSKLCRKASTPFILDELRFLLIASHMLEIVGLDLRVYMKKRWIVLSSSMILK